MSAAAHEPLQSANAAAAEQLNGKEGSSADLERGSNGIAGPSTELAPAPGDSFLTRTWKHLDGEVDSNQCTFQLLAYCLITGWVDAVSFSAVFIFTGFQTGNTVQLAAAIGRTFSGPDRSKYFFPADRLALTSLCTFVLGAFFGGQIGDRLGPKKRWWLIGITLFQSGCMMVSFITQTVSGEASVASEREGIAWTDTAGYIGLAFISVGMGIQAITAKRLNTHYGTTVVLTTIWTELAADPGLFKLKPVPSRDHRIGAVFGLFLGALASRIILNYIGGGASMGIGAAIKVVVALSFWFVPSKVVKKS